METKHLTENVLWNLRTLAAANEDCETSRLCSRALWGTPRQKREAKLKLARR